MRISSSSMLEMPEMRADPSSLSLSLSLLPTEARKPRLRLCLHVPLSSGQGRERGLSSFPPSLHPSFLPSSPLSFLPHLSLARSQLVKVQMSVRPHPTWFPLTDHSVPPSLLRSDARLPPPSCQLPRPLARLSVYRPGLYVKRAYCEIDGGRRSGYAPFPHLFLPSVLPLSLPDPARRRRRSESVRSVPPNPRPKDRSSSQMPISTPPPLSPPLPPLSPTPDRPTVDRCDLL